MNAEIPYDNCKPFAINNTRKDIVMKNVMLLGDSIRLIGYGTKVPEILGEDFNVLQPQENCRFSSYTLRGLHDWLPKLDNIDVVHWNNGIWDVCEYYGDGYLTPPEQYCETMLRIARILKANAKTVIFATTTPIIDPHKSLKNESIELYNALIVPKLQEMGIIINDLYSFVKPNIDRFIREDKVHLSAEGIDACAERVAMFIRNATE